MPKLVLIPHSKGSRAVKALAETLSRKLGYKVWRVTPEKVRGRIALHIGQGTDKLTQMERFKNAGVCHPEYTSDRSVALNWLPNGAVVARTLLRSSEGRGIVIAETPEQVVEAPLYTKYLKKKAEYRVHVFQGKVIDVQEKRRKGDYSGPRDSRIRNLANGYVFCRGALNEPLGLRDLAIRATTSLGYPLGAVDIIYNEHLNSLVVLEVNSNPGLQGTTLENYSNAIANWAKENQNSL